MDQAPEQSAEDRIMAMMDAPEVKEEVKEEVKQEEPKQEEVKTEEAQPETEAETVEIDPDAKFIEVELTVEGGEKRIEKLSLNELKAQRMMQADYQRKTQELARQRDEVPEKIRQGITEHLQKSLQELQSLQAMFLQTVAPELNNVDLNKLAVEDPAEYVRVSNRQRQIEQAWRQMEATKQQRMQELESQQKAQMQKLREDARSKIKSEIQNFDEIENVLIDTAVKSYGFTAEQLDAIHHPGFAKLLHDAHEYQKTKSATKTIVEKKVVNVPKVVKPGTPKDNPGRERVTESFQKLRKSGRVEDAAAAIFHTLK